MIPIKCQLCPYFQNYGRGYGCSRVRCELQDNEKLRKQIYKAIENLKEGK